MHPAPSPLLGVHEFLCMEGKFCKIEIKRGKLSWILSSISNSMGAMGGGLSFKGKVSPLPPLPRRNQVGTEEASGDLMCM